MAAQTISLVTTGGTAPYTYSIIHDSQTTLPLPSYPQPGNSGYATVSFNMGNSEIVVDATNVNPGIYKLHINITDSTTPIAKIATRVVTVKVLNSTKFSILNESESVIPGSFPYQGTIFLESSGATGAVIWSLLPSMTTLPGAAVTSDGFGNPVVTYSTSQYGSFTVGLQAKDSFKTVTRTLTIGVLAPSAYKLADGQVEVVFNDAGYTEGTHSFSVSVTDSQATPASTTRSFEYLLQPKISTINIPQSFVKYWHLQDTNEIFFPITGTLSGLSIQDSSGTFSNGVTYSVEGAARRVKFSGPPTVAENSQLTVPINLQFSNTIVASVSKTFTVPAFAGAYDESSIASVCYTRPLVSGEFFSLNPQKPYFNSPSIERHTWIAKVASNNTLPQGLNLDANTGLIYGKILATTPHTTVIDFYDPDTKLVKGIIEIHFDIVSYDFSLIETLPSWAVSFDYNGLISTTSNSDLSEATVYSGTLPSGLAFGVSRLLSTGLLTFNASLSQISRAGGSWVDDGVHVGSKLTFSTFATTANNKDFTVTTVTNATVTVAEPVTLATESGVVTAYTKAVISGNPTEAGHFDLWLKVKNVDGKLGFLYKRLEIFYSTPLSVLTSSLPTLTNQPYAGILSAVGGSGVYTWSLNAGSPALPAGITLSTSGLLSGTYAGSSYNSNIVVKVVDSKGASATATLTLTFSNTLSVVTASIPKIIRGEYYSFTMKAYGGTAIYTNWTVPGGSLPSGITLSSAGVLSGFVATGTVFTPANINFTVTDSSAATASRSLAVGVADAASVLAIDTSGVGVINKGCNYQGVMKVSVGASTAIGPFHWEIAPGSPNQLPTGLTLSFSGDGMTAFVSGKCILALSNYSVKIRVIDANGLSAITYLLLSSTPSVKITTKTLSQGKVSTGLNPQFYNQTITGESCNNPWTFSLDTSSPALPAGLSLNSSGFLTGSPTAVYNNTIVIKLTDALNDSITQPLLLVIKNSDLILATTSIPSISSGKDWSYQLVAQDGAGSYKWSISPDSTIGLPSNVQLNETTGVISTSGTNALGTRSIIFRVTDADGTHTDKSLSLVVVASQAITPGPDYINGTSHGYLGYIRQDISSLTSQIIPRPSKSFYAILTNFASTSLSQISVTTSNPAITAIVEAMTSNEVLINITQTPASVLGDNTFTLTVVDNATPVSAVLKYKVIEGRDVNVTLLDGSNLPVQSFQIEGWIERPQPPPTTA